MKLDRFQLVLANWVENNMLSVFPEYSWQRFLGAASIPVLTSTLMKHIESNLPMLTELGVYSQTTGIDLDKLKEFAEAGFAKCPKIQIPFMGEQFWINKENADTLLKQLKDADIG